MSCNRIPNARKVKRAARAVGRAVRRGARRTSTVARRVLAPVRRHPNPEVYVYGTKGLGLDLHQWHASMSDPIYALGSSWYVGRGVPLPVAEAAAENLERMAARGHKSGGLARKVRARIRAASRRSNPAVECDYLTGGPRTHLGEKVTLYGRRWHLQRCHTPVRGRSAWLGVDPQGATRTIVKQAVRNKTYRGKGPVASRPKPKKRGKR